MALSRDAVVGAGVELAGAEGLDAVSLRAVAVRLGVTPMALYRHVTDSAALLRAVIDRVVAEVPGVVAEVEPTGALRQWAEGSRAVLRPYPGAARHLLTHWFDMSPMLEVTEDLLGAVGRLGLDGFEAVAAVNALFMFVLMRVEAEQAVLDAKVVRRTLRLPRAGLPLLRANRRFYEVAQFDAHFRYGLDLIIDRISTGAAGR